MARAFAEAVVQDPYGNVLPGVAIDLLDPVTNLRIPDTVYADASSGLTLTLPALTNASGKVPFYLATGKLVKGRVTLGGQTYDDLLTVSDPTLVGPAGPPGGDTFNVKAYTATGDGTTDDRGFIAAAETASGSAAISFTAGTYRIASNVTLGDVVIAPGAMLSPDSGVVVTITGTITAPGNKQIFTGAGTISVPTAGPGMWANWWGAIGNGTHDDTAAIQAAVNCLLGTTQHAGDLHFAAPSLYYKLTQTITVFSGTTQNHVNLYFDGYGQNGVNVGWFGATTGTAIELSNDFGGLVVHHLSIGNFAGAGSTVGVNITSNAGTGTGVSPGLMESCAFASFATGCLLGGGPGGNGGAASEIVFVNPIFNSCTNGLQLISFNTLDITLINPSFAANTIGLKSGFTSQLNILGGSGSNNGSDFALAASGTSVIANYRSEGVVTAFLAGGGVVTLLACLCQDVPSGGGSAISGVAHLTMIGSQINGWIDLSSTGEVVMTDNFVLPSPLLGGAAPFSTTGQVAFDCRSTRHYDTGLAFDDMIGIGDGALLGTQHRITRNLLAPLPAQDLRTVQGISHTQVQAQNLCGSVTFAGAGTAPVVFGQADVQTVSLTGSPTGGSITFAGFQGHHFPSQQASFNATAAQVQAAVAALPNVGVGNVVCAGGPLPAAVTITFSGTLAQGPQYALTAANSLTGGSSPAVVLAHTTVGTFPEADANYTVNVTGNIGETFWVTGKATTGFTIHSSNAASTATVDWQLIR
jgi:hypothetical protein